jgi:hypothetical protein
MGIYDYLQEDDRADTIYIGVWKRSSGDILILGTHFACSSDYEHDRTRCSTTKDKSADEHGRR